MSKRKRTMEWLELKHCEVEINVAGNVMLYPDDDGDPNSATYISFPELEKIFRTAQRLRLGSIANK